MKFNLKFRKAGEGREWPSYLPGGRVRTSTAALVVAFCFTWWLHSTYAPPPTPPASQAPQIVPPGYVPDPEYTWVPRTNVETQPRTTYSTTRTRTTQTSTTVSTTPTETTSGTDTPTTSTPETATTVVDPDGPGPLPATTVTQTPITSPGQPVPNRSGTPTTTVTTILPGITLPVLVPPPPG
ncbi:hypothetical protein [Mycolicibacterium sp. P1-18]|uniref:hypothetical protein n=1 Tax=Mycolicibacterium sp. P1-18 TaxID=2024615 RepID=UPI0018D788AB|nr:hypothetical protein [Mycolicibacterium sp. P1-18]